VDEGTEAEEEILRQLKWENRALKERLFELEEKIRTLPASSAPGQSGRDSSVLKLLKAKDAQLDKVAQDHQRATADLEKKVAELSRWMEALRVYREIFEKEPSAMVVVDSEGAIALFNGAALQMLGEKFRSMLNRPIEEADFGSFDPSTARMVRSTLSSRVPGYGSVRVRGGLVETSTFPLGTPEEPEGALLRIRMGAG
jgi:PAS domain S-box-containing protein